MTISSDTTQLPSTVNGLSVVDVGPRQLTVKWAGTGYTMQRSNFEVRVVEPRSVLRANARVENKVPTD